MLKSTFSWQANDFISHQSMINQISHRYPKNMLIRINGYVYIKQLLDLFKLLHSFLMHSKENESIVDHRLLYYKNETIAIFLLIQKILAPLYRLAHSLIWIIGIPNEWFWHWSFFYLTKHDSFNSFNQFG